MKSLITLSQISVLIVFAFALELSRADSKSWLVAEVIRKEVSKGLVHERHQLVSDDGPIIANVLYVDPNKHDLQMSIAKDRILGKERPSELAFRHGALAAINGGYFAVRGDYAGDFLGFFMKEGRVLSEPIDRRSSFGYCVEDLDQAVRITSFSQDSTISRPGGKRLVVNGINRLRGSNELVLYTPELGRTTLTSDEGLELIVENHVVSRVNNLGNSQIPKNGYVLSFSGTSHIKLALSEFSVGTQVELLHELTERALPLFRTQKNYEGCTFTSGGPRLIRNGQVRVEVEESSKFTPAFVERRHPRTAVGILKDGMLVFLTVDGRQPKYSVGMSLEELANYLFKLGVWDGVNLDGGGSSTMVIGNKVVNRPSDKTGERPSSDSILVFSRS